MLFFSAISFGLNQLFRGQLVAAMAAAKPGPSAGLAMFSSAWYWLLMLSSLILASVQWAGAIDGLLKTASGAPTSLGECFSKGLAKALPFLALSVLWILGVTFASVLFVIPGLILMTMWSVSLPALVGENLGVFASFGRSRALTKGTRLPIFGVLIIALLIAYAPMLIFGRAAGMFGDSASGGLPSAGFYLFALPYSWLVAWFLSAVLTSLYLETILAKEGGNTSRLNTVFE